MITNNLHWKRYSILLFCILLISILNVSCKDISEMSVEELKEKAEQGDADAQFRLGECYFNGNDIKQDYKAGANWFTKAAEQEHAGAQYRLGLCYLFGNGVEKNDENRPGDCHDALCRSGRQSG